MSTMDVLGVNMKSKGHVSKRSKKAVKVVYISSPMKVKTSASQFRALVQELTGKDSDAARFMDSNDVVNGDGNCSLEALQHQRAADHTGASPLVPSLMKSSSYPESSVESVFEQFDEGLMPAIEGSFMEMLRSNLFQESYQQLGVLN